jgi:dipeptidyl aminopeptidase
MSSYGGPESQQVQKTFKIDFQAYMAGGLDYLVITVDGRCTGFIGRKARVVVRHGGNLGHWESHDQIETARDYASLPYVDALVVDFGN